jgi:hypothetical protein
MADRVQLINPLNGELYSVDAPEAEAAQAQYGLVPATPDQIQAYQTRMAGEQAGAGAAFGRNAASAIAAPILKAGEFFGADISPEEKAAAADLFKRTAESRAAYPITSMAGGALPEVAIGAATGGLGTGASLAARGALFAGETALGAVTSEATDAAVEQRPMTAEGILKNGALSLGFSALGHGLGAAYRRVTGSSPLVESAENAFQSKVTKATVEVGDDLSDPAVASAVRSKVDAATNEILDSLDKSTSEFIYSVKGPRDAQRQALEQAAEQLRYDAPDVAEALDKAVRAGVGSRKMFTTVLEHPALEDLASNRALWGKAVDQATALRAARDARVQGPAAYAEALRAIDDPSISSKLAELDDHLENAAAVDSAAAFAPEKKAKSGGAAAADFDESDYATAIKEIGQGKVDPQVFADAAPGIRHLAANDAAQTFDAIRGIANQDAAYANKIENFQKGAEKWTPEHLAKQSEWTNEVVDEARKIVDRIKSDKAAGPLGFDAKGIGTDAVNKIEARVARLGGQITPAARNHELDLLKRDLDSVITQLTNNKTLDTGTKQALDDIIKPFAHKLRNGLEDEATWGNNGVLQSAVNEAFHKLIEPKSRFEKKFSEFLGKEWGEYGSAAMNRETQVSAIEAAMAKRGGLGQMHEVANEMLDGLQDLLAAFRDHGIDAPDSLKQGIEQIESFKNSWNLAQLARIAENKAGVSADPALNAAADLAGYVPKVGAAVSAGRTVLNAVKSLGRGNDLAPAGSATRRVLDSHLKRLARTQAHLLSDPGFSYEMISHGPLREALKKAGAPLAGVGGLIAMTRDAEAAEALQRDSDDDTASTARAMTDPEYAARYVKRTKGQPSTMDRFVGVFDNLSQAYADARATVEQMGRDPEALIDAMAQAFGDLPDELSQGVGAKAFQVAQYLQSKLPPVRGVSVTRPNGLPPSSLEMRTFALHYMTATNPRTAFDDAKRGVLRHEQVESLKANWPGLYDDLVTQTVLAMGNGKSTIVQRQRADLLFGLGTALDPAFSSRLSKVARAAEAKRDQGGAGSAPQKTNLPGISTPGGINALSLGAAAPQ